VWHLLRVLLVEHTENHADGPTTWWTLPTTSKPTTTRDAYAAQPVITATGSSALPPVAKAICLSRAKLKASAKQVCRPEAEPPADIPPGSTTAKSSTLPERMSASPIEVPQRELSELRYGQTALRWLT
jgi:hypothetical protein